MLGIRDWQLNDERFAEPFLEEVCRTNACAYEALPIFDGMRWQGRIAFLAEGEPLKGRFARPVDAGNDILNIRTAGGGLEITLEGETAAFRHRFRSFALRMERKETGGASWRGEKGALVYRYRGMTYVLAAEGASIDVKSDRVAEIRAAGASFRLTTSIRR